MLLRFRVANFRSLRDEQELSMVASSRDERGGVVHVEDLGLDVLRVAGIYGANAAGKSNVLAALKFMRNAVTRSHRVWKPEEPVPREPFLLDPKTRSAPSLFEVDFLLDGVRYRYGFRLDDERVLGEWLYAYPHRRPQLWFLRDAQGFQIGKHLRGNNRAIEALTRKNSLFLSVAAQNNHQALSPIYSWFAEQIWFARNEDRDSRISFTRGMLEEDRHKRAVLDLLRLADLGISEIRLQERPLEGSIEEAIRALKASLAMTDLDSPETGVVFAHRSSGEPVALAFDLESSGTHAWFALAGPILWALEHGSLLCVDELDASLHPRLAFEVIRIFEDPAGNPRNAQLIFNTHDTTLLGNLLGEPDLRRDQVWFVEKDEQGATHLYPLTDFKPRKSENLERGYLQGRYGAVPFIEPPVFTEDE